MKLKPFKLRGATALAMLMGAAFGLNTARAKAAIDVVATLPELASITREVGGNKVSVYSVAKPNRDYHTIEPRPSDVQRVARAHLVVRTGMKLEMWMDSIINAARNPKANQYVNCSLGIRRMDVPNEQISGASGDVHVDGNPHFYYDPIYGKFIARNILKGLIRVDPKDADYFRANYTRFNSEIDQHMVSWHAQLAPYAGHPVVTYHENFGYFIRRFGLREYGHLEPKPGIPPSAAHLNALISNMNRDHVRALVIESIYPTRSADLVARQTHQKYVVAPYSVSSENAGSYFDLVDSLVARFKQALS